MMNWGEIEQKKQKHWKRRRRRRFGPMVAVDLRHQIAILLFVLCLFEFGENVVGMAQNCTKRREEGRSTLLMGESKLECPSLRAFSQFTFEANSSKQIGNFELNCGGEEMMENETMNALGQIQKEFPALRQISLHNCSIQFIHQFSTSKLLPSNLEWLNLSGNRGMHEFGWKRIGQNQLKLLDLGSNELECQNCANSWMIQSMRDQGQQQWPIRSIFPIIPERLILPDSIRRCQFPQCAAESAKFEATEGLDNLRLGDRLEIKCKFRTQNALQMVSSAPIFIWPLNEEGDKDEENVGKIEGNGTINNGGEKFQTTKLLPAENAALLRITHLKSEHLGYLACRCLHCNVPHFDIVELRFPVPISLHIPSGNPPGERHLILHGFPLDGPIQMEIQWTEVNWTQSREFDWDEQNDHHGQIQTRLFFNGSLAIRPEFGHSQFFLRYFSLSIHECTGCEHFQGGGTFRFRICVGKKAEKEVGGKENCAELTHRIEPPVYSISQRKDFLGAQLASNSPFSFLHFLISIPPILLSLALLTLGARMVWRLKQRMAIREKLKRRGRRASRNTQRTEETSIPLDTMSRSLSLSNYIQSQLHVPLIDSRELQLNERIGKGAFGEVYVAIWRRPLRTMTVEEEEESNDSSLVLTPKENGQQNPQQNGPNNGEKEPRKVAVKMLTSIQMDAEMDREAALLARLEHPNVLRMFGIAHWSGQIALVLELMNLGDLRNYLRNREPRCNNYAQFPPALLQTELVDICIQICEGLCYLAQQQIVHRDLAARNCLVSGESDLHCCSAAFRPSICVKISDFGMSRRLYASAEYYRMQDKKTALPVRKCDAIGVLWLTRELIRQGFDIKLFIPNSYMAGPFADKVSENFILEELRDLGLLTIIYDHCHDDILMLEYAKITGGFIISNDKYRDHEMDFKTRDHDAVKIIRERVVRFHFQKLNFEDKMVRKWLGRGGQELMSSPKANAYLGIECVLKPPSMKAMYSWDQRGDETHGIVFHQRMLRSQRTAEKCLERLNCICEFMRLRFCEINFIKAELPDWHDPENQLFNFGTFWNRFTNWQREGRKKRKEKQKKMYDFYGYQGQQAPEEEKNWTNSQRNSSRRGGGLSNSNATPPKSRIMAYNGVDDDSSRRDIWKEE